MNSIPNVWVLADDRAGNVAQCLGVAEALALPLEVKQIRYNRLASLPNALRGATLLGLTADSRRALAGPPPAVVIAAGRRTAPVARWLKRRGARLAVQIMDPGAPGRADFDLIVVPTHDGNPPKGANILRVTGAPHRVTHAKLAEAANQWRERFAMLPRPYIALIVGGATKDKPFTKAMAIDLADKAGLMAAQTGGSLLVTTSRRTGEEQERLLLEAIPEPCALYRWNDGGENPYFGYLALADAVIVTGDSVSMCTEACATPAPVYIYAPPGTVSAKHARLHRELYDLGLAKPLGEPLTAWTHAPLNPAADIAAAVRKMLKLVG